jgi:hypothetical protein
MVIQLTLLFNARPFREFRALPVPKASFSIRVIRFIRPIRDPTLFFFVPFAFRRCLLPLFATSPFAL